VSRWLGALLLALALAAAAQAQPAEGRAGLVVQYGDGEVQTACVRFGEPEISGIELLERSGIPAVVQGGSMGAAVCKIGPEGCDYPAESCFCERDGARSTYWAFYSLEGGDWSYAILGAGGVSVRDGTVHGWAWGEGDSGSGARPPLLSIDELCGAEAQPTAADGPATPAAQPTRGDAAPATAAPDATTAASPAAPSEPAASGSGGGWPLSYLGFAALALALIAGAALAARRRGPR
jgi:hypothetical protein